MPVHRSSCTKIIERIDRIRLRAYLEKDSGIPAADREAFLEMCRRHEQRDHLDLASVNDNSQDLQHDEIDPCHLGSFSDFDKYTARC